MKYEHTPRPRIEDHYHIRELIEAQERRHADRTDYRTRLKDSQERAQSIKDTKIKDTKAFWCRTCKEDFLAEAIKDISTDWSCPIQDIAVYRTKCFKGHWCMRLITDTHKDAYWTRSRRVAVDKGQHYADTLQPYETGFNMMYKKI
jgi:hypothetical protein